MGLFAMPFPLVSGEVGRSVCDTTLSVVSQTVVPVGVGPAKQVRGETLKPRAPGSVIGEPG
jgi:hypothetical protein